MLLNWVSPLSNKNFSNNYASSNYASPVSYLAIPAAEQIQKVIKALKTVAQNNPANFKRLLASWKQGKTQTLIGWLSKVNELRLYWIWGNSLLDMIFSLAQKTGKIGTSFFTQLERKLQFPRPVTGNMSWILYYTRFFLGLGLLLKNTIQYKKPEIPWWERFLTEWNKRKFQLLNDGIWGLANQACYFWLTSGVSKRMGMYGDFLTALLLVMDVSLTLWKIAEKQEKYRLEKQEIENITIKIEELEKAFEKEEDPNKKLSIQETLTLNREKKATKERDLKYEKYNDYNDISYAASLLVAFCLLAGILLPAGALLTSAAMILGAIACFSLTVLYSAVSNILPVKKMREEIRQLQEQWQILEKEFNELLTENSNQTDDEAVLNRQKELFIRIEDLKEKTLFIEKKLAFQTGVAVRGLIIDILTPAVVLVAIMILPTGLGLAGLSAAFVLAVASKLVMNYFEPKELKNTEYDEKAFKEFREERFKLFKPPKPTDEDKNSESELNPAIVPKG